MNRMHDRTQRRCLPLVLGGALLIAALPVSVLAQAPPAEAPLPAAPSAPLQLEEKKLDQFADAFVVVQQIQREALARLEQETDQQKAAALKAQAESDAAAAVAKTGLPVVEFNQIVQLMVSDLALREKVAERVARRRSAQTPTG